MIGLIIGFAFGWFVCDYYKRDPEERAQFRADIDEAIGRLTGSKKRKRNQRKNNP